MEIVKEKVDCAYLSFTDGKETVEITMLDHGDLAVVFVIDADETKTILLTHEQFNAMMALYNARYL